MAHPPAVDVRRLIAQLKLVKDQHIYDEALRKQLCDAVRDVALAKETPKESVERIFYAVRRPSSSLVHCPWAVPTLLTIRCNITASATDHGESRQ